ncbi:MAG: hypothetical protein IJK94_01460, partial [Bacteroidaceae bacterium]|nr:hypothetical protein [Bacteroidaceae bacterium]
GKNNLGQHHVWIIVHCCTFCLQRYIQYSKTVASMLIIQHRVLQVTQKDSPFFFTLQETEMEERIVPPLGSAKYAIKEAKA